MQFFSDTSNITVVLTIIVPVTALVIYTDSSLAVAPL